VGVQEIRARSEELNILAAANKKPLIDKYAAYLTPSVALALHIFG
jgi:hypothetical protein